MSLAKEYLQTLAVAGQDLFRVDPDAAFPMDVGDGEHYIPVRIGRALSHEGPAREVARYIMRLYFVEDLDARYTALERVLKKNEATTTVPVIVFYALGYRVDDNRVVDARRARTLDDFIKTFLVPEGTGDEVSRFRILLVSRSGTRTYAEILALNQQEAERALRFLTEVIVPLANAERIIITEGLMALSGAQALRLIRPLLGLISRLQEIVALTRGGIELARIYGNLPTVRLIIGFVRPWLERLAILALKGIGLYGDIDTASQVLAELTRAYVALDDSVEFQQGVSENGGVVLDSWDELTTETEAVAAKAIKELMRSEAGVSVE